jgi:hypothetical protein
MMVDARASLHTRDSLEHQQRTEKSRGFFAVDRGAFRSHRSDAVSVPEMSSTVGDPVP